MIAKIITGTNVRGLLQYLTSKNHEVITSNYVFPDSSPPEIAKEMEDSVNEVKKTRHNIIWIDEMLPKNEVIQLYSHADVFCCPSIYEPFGIINVEGVNII